MTSRDWMVAAKCRGEDPELFFPPAGQAGRPVERRALGICRQCPVVAECRVYALTDGLGLSCGVWGGLGHNELRAVAVTRTVNGSSCQDAYGTNRGAQRHRRAGETPCPPCQQAATLYQQLWWTGRKQGIAQ